MDEYDTPILSKRRILHLRRVFVLFEGQGCQVSPVGADSSGQPFSHS